jgi:polyphenol oxidase
MLRNEMKEITDHDWPKPDNIHAFYTTRQHGVSEGHFSSLNLASHVDDEWENVQQNRAILREHLVLPREPAWLEQTHSDKISEITVKGYQQDADASFTRQAEYICAVLTADCLPILLCSSQGDCVAAIHAGWRGLYQGIIAHCVQAMSIPGRQLQAWLGPAISQAAYEVDVAFQQRFIALSHDYAACFQATGSEHYLADLYAIARLQLQQVEIDLLYGATFCTHTDAKQFFSYRRDGVTGRQACLIYLT